MPKGQQRNNREKRKPKAVKAKQAAATASAFVPASGASKSSVGKKGR